MHAASILDGMIKRIRDDKEGHTRRDSTAQDDDAFRAQLFTTDACEDGMRVDTERYLRMNRLHRQELVLPKLGVVGTD